MRHAVVLPCCARCLHRREAFERALGRRVECAGFSLQGVTIHGNILDASMAGAVFINGGGNITVRQRVIAAPSAFSARAFAAFPLPTSVVSNNDCH